MRPAGSRRINLRFRKPELRILLPLMGMTLPWPLSSSHGRQTQATIIRKPKPITRSIHLAGKTLLLTGTLKHQDWPCYLPSWQIRVQAMQAIYLAGRQSQNATLTGC